MGTEDPQPTPESDARLVRSALKGDLGAREQLADRMVIVLKILTVLNARRGRPLSRHDVEDLAQDTLLRAWEKLPTFHLQATLEGWVYRFCFLEYMNRVRTKSRALRMELLDPDEFLRGPKDDPWGDAGEKLELLLEELDPAESLVLRLKHYEGCSFVEIGKRLAVHPSTIKTRYYRALARMEERLTRGRTEVRP